MDDLVEVGSAQATSPGGEALITMSVKKGSTLSPSCVWIQWETGTVELRLSLEAVQGGSSSSVNDDFADAKFLIGERNVKGKRIQ